MHIGFYGAAHTVTGSKHLITLNNGENILLDCGLFQGLGKETLVYNSSFGFEPATVNYLILSHAHIDHTGLIPKLVADGFAGPIYCTPATKDLVIELLKDSAHIQESDVRFVNKKKAARGLPLIKPLYTKADVEKALSLLHPVNYQETFIINKDCSFYYTDTGHILGSAAVHLSLNNNGTTTRVTFSGDVGRYTDAILKQPEIFTQADYILLESTYGNSLHQEHTDTELVLEQQIKHTCVDKKGCLIIPAFSVGRTQELLFALNNLSLQNKLPNVPIYVDSPLSVAVTSIIKKYPKYYNDGAQEIMHYDDDVFNFNGLTFIDKKEDSKKLNEGNQPCVIISASGMAEAGRVKHHIANKISDAKNTILLVGYCSPMSLGGALKAGNKEVRIFMDMYAVNAEVASMRSMSAHGDYEDLLQFLSCQDKSKLKNIFLVHGEQSVKEAFKNILYQQGYSKVHIPAMKEIIELN